MIETIHIFDEFCQSPQELTLEDRHKKRIAMEPLIFGILQKKYGNILHNFWKTHTVPQNSDKSIVIIERRVHPNLAFLLYNAAYFARDWSITLLCSDINYSYCAEILGHNLENVTLYPIFNGNASPEEGKKQYNSLLQDANFYKSFKAENLLFLETDCYLRKPIPDDILQYDYIAAPYVWNKKLSGGGLSFRKRSAMIQICESFPEKLPAQDVYVCNGINKLELKMPPYDKGTKYITESVFSKKVFGVHQWWTFFFPRDFPEAESYFTELLTFELQAE